MKLRSFGSTLWVALALITFSSVASAIDIGTSSSFRNQRFEAWGSSLAWLGNEIGGSSNTFRRDQMMDLLFDPSNGLGLNFVRYNIGAGQNPAGPAITRPGGDMDGWVPNAPSSVTNPSTWNFDWNADATQRWVLDAAIERGVTQVEAFANSAPWWMTNNLSSRGTGPGNGQANLDTANYEAFGHYLLEVTEHFENNLGIQFHSLAPMNEPGAGWWNGSNNQEGMNIPQGNSQSSLIREIGEQLISRGLDVGLVGPEETSIRDTLNSYNDYGTITRSFISQINTHSYPFRGGSDPSDADALVAYNNSRPEGPKKIYATEFGTGGNSTPLSGGITLAKQIQSDLRNLGAAGWTYWQAVEDNNGSNWGLIIAPFDGNNNWFNMRKQYYAMQHFSSHIRPGSHILEQSNSEVTAAYDPRTDTTTLVVVNDDAATDSHSFDLLDQTGAYTRTIRTSDTGELYTSLGSGTATGTSFGLAAPENTVTTMVIHHKPNLIRNPNLDLGSGSNGSPIIPNWRAVGSAAFDTGFNHSNDSSGTARLQTDDTANEGMIFQGGIGDADIDITGVAFQMSADIMFQNSGNNFYDAETFLSVEFYGADGNMLTHDATTDFETEVIPALSVDETRSFDSDYRTFRSDRFVAPEGTRFVRPVIKFRNVDSDSNDWTYIDNIYLQEVHPEAAAKEWQATGGGEWTDHDNWLSHSLVENNRHAYFGNSIVGNSMIQLDTIESITGLTFFSEHEYQIGGSGVLLIGNTPETPVALIDGRWGQHQVSVITAFQSDVTVQVLKDASISFDAALSVSGNELLKLGAGTLDLASGFSLDGGKLLAYASSDSQIILGDEAILDGDFELLASPGQAFEIGDAFELVSYSTLPDSFDNILLPNLPVGLAWEVDYGVSELTAMIVGDFLDGDYDRNGIVDFVDYGIWISDFGSTTRLFADGNGNGIVDAADFTIWQDNFGRTQIIVPEPSSGVSLLLLTALAWRRKRRRDVRPSQT